MNDDSSILYGGSAAAASPSRRTVKKRSVIPFLIIWLLLIGGGVYGTYQYSQNMKQELSAELKAQTSQQIALLQSDYNKRLDAMDKDWQAELAVLSDKVQVLNELLAFAKDNAGSSSDNSNQLYSQLREVKQKLEQLEKSLDVLK